MSDETQAPAPIEAPPARARKSRAGWIAALLVLALAGWMGSGYYYPAESTVAEAPRERTRTPMAVETTASTAKPITEFVTSEGQVTPARQTPVRAKVGGTVESIAVEKGAFLQEGALIARIALADRAAQRVQAEAELARRQGEFDRVSGLAQQGYATTAAVEDARAALAAAKAALAEINQTAGNTEIRAPITGILDQFEIDIGEFVAASAEVGVQVDIDPLLVEVQIPQQSIGKLKTGQTAEVTFITGETREGVVEYIASNATEETRTFPVEISVPNPGRDIPSGISAEVRIPVGRTPAHFLSAALLALDSDGTLGVKAVDAENRVVFYPIELVRAETSGIWVAGLPERLDLISVGQGFVSAGETVRVIEAVPETGTPAAEPDLPAGDVPVAAAQPDETAGADRLVATANNEADSPVDTALLQEPAPEASRNASVSDDSAEDWSVREVQRRLQTLGYDPGPVDGVLGEGTREAIRALQEDRGLEATGEIGPALVAELFETEASGS